MVVKVENIVSYGPNLALAKSELQFQPILEHPMVWLLQLTIQYYTMEMSPQTDNVC